MDSVSLKQTRVIIHEDHISNVSAIDFPHSVPGVDYSWNIERFKQKFSVKINYLDEMELEFDLVGVDASLANTFRRIMISEVPTMAIESVFVMNNTGVMQDEVLAHRLGLIPIKADPRLFEFKQGGEIHPYIKSESDAPTDLNTIVFKIDVICTNNPTATSITVDPKDKYCDSEINSSHLQWVPQGDQSERFVETPIKPIRDDILITKLRPGQEIQLELHCNKGIGREHAKWSPVGTAFYRLLPEIHILKPIIGKPITFILRGTDAHKFQSCFPPGVIGIKKAKNGVEEAFVKDARLDTVSRECLRHPEFKDKILLSRVRDHFIYGVESTGILPPDDIFEESVLILIEKCKLIKNTLLNMGLEPTAMEE